MRTILIAGIGNIFQGDDAFGCEVARQLGSAALPGGVEVRDFGIRGYDLAYALNGDYDFVILVDAAPRGGEPGSVYLLELDPEKEADLENLADAHSMTPVAVIRMAKALGGIRGKLYLAGCEPGVLEDENGGMGLSEKVAAAVPVAVKMIEGLLGDLMGEGMAGD
jgi:hydrogenase maturation protease